MFITSFTGRRLFKATVITLISILFIIDISINAVEMIKSRVYQFHQKEDVAFDIEQWWHNNIPLNAKIIADHYVYVYIPAGYKNIKTLSWNEENRALRLRQLVNTYRPQFIYYNAGLGIENPLPSIEEILPGKKVKLVKSFDSKGRRYQRRPQDKFVIYEVLY